MDNSIQNHLDNHEKILETFNEDLFEMNEQPEEYVPQHMSRKQDSANERGSCGRSSSVSSNSSRGSTASSSGSDTDVTKTSRLSKTKQYNDVKRNKKTSRPSRPPNNAIGKKGESNTSSRLSNTTPNSVSKYKVVDGRKDIRNCHNADVNQTEQSRLHSTSHESSRKRPHLHGYDSDGSSASRRPSSQQGANKRSHSPTASTSQKSTNKVSHSPPGQKTGRQNESISDKVTNDQSTNRCGYESEVGHLSRQNYVGHFTSLDATTSQKRPHSPGYDSEVSVISSSVSSPRKRVTKKNKCSDNFTGTDTHMPPPASINQHLMKDIITTKSMMPDFTTSKTRSIRSRVSTSKQDIDLMKELQQHLRELELPQLTIDIMKKSFYPISKNKDRSRLVEEVQMIEDLGVTLYDPLYPEEFPRIEPGDYLCSKSSKKEYLLEPFKDGLSDRTLYHAMRPQYKEETHSLDKVFRSCLKDLSDEYHAYDPNIESTLENSLFISSQYLEIKLLQKIKNYYLAHLGQDVIKELSMRSPPPSTLTPLIKDCVCEKYIKKLFDSWDSYGLRCDTIDELMKKPMTSSTEMRVWTYRKVQSNMNIKIKNSLLHVYEKLKPQEGSDNFGRLFIMEYTKHMKPFLDANEEFITRMLKVSELMAWMCFGATSADIKTGFLSMCYSYIKINSEKFENVDPGVCWNYPLRSMFAVKAVVNEVKKSQMLQEEFLAEAGFL